MNKRLQIIDRDDVQIGQPYIYFKAIVDGQYFEPQIVHPTCNPWRLNEKCNVVMVKEVSGSINIKHLFPLRAETVVEARRWGLYMDFDQMQKLIENGFKYRSAAI